jgi:catechol 2,3-dioxygenase-like lactoylglutathione lyase family enzyme
MLDHVGIEVRDYERSKAFYLAALKPLGVSLLMEFGSATAGFGEDTEHGPKPYFHAAALAAGETDNGAPGPRPIYHPGYYGAFVLDPDGNNVEAVCHRV